MYNKQFLILVIVASLLGGVCGAILTHVFTSKPTFAQMRPKGKVVSAEEFTLLDEKGNIRLSLTMTPDDSINLALYDEGGKTQAGFVMSLSEKPSLIFQSKGGKTIWSAP
jgi:hypothetical protein